MTDVRFAHPAHSMQPTLKAVMRRVLAQGLVEYGLILSLVAVLVIASLLLFHPAMPSLLSKLSTSV